MKCLWEEIEGTRDERGWRRVSCTRRECQWTNLIQAPPPDDTIHVDCGGFPNYDEPGEWINYFAVTFSLDRTEAEQWFNQWVADGSDISELPKPAGSPSLHGADMSPQGGPGTELKKLLDSLGIRPTESCDCAARQADMDRLGVDGCRRERATILRWLHEGYDESTIATRLKAGTIAMATGLPLTLEGLLDEAIRRADSKASAGSDS